MGDSVAGKIMEAMWNRPVNRKTAQGVHGTLFYQVIGKKRYYPTKKESEMVPPGMTRNLKYNLCMR